MPRFPLSRPFRLWALAFGAVLAAGVWGYRAWKPGPLRIVLSTREDPTDGMAPSQRRALRDWTQWQLEAAGCTVLAPGSGRIPPPKGALLIELAPRRAQDQLSLAWKRARAEDLAKRGEAAWTFSESGMTDPMEALRALDRSLPLPEGPTWAERLLPRRTETFWRLLDAVAGNRDSSRLADGHDLALAATRDEPGCATAWMVLGDLHYRRMLVAPLSDPMGQAEAEQHFRRALDLAPENPEARFLLAQLKVDSGDHAGALGELQRGLKTRPRALVLRTALVYAARTAGLLDLTRASLAEVDRLVPPGFQSVSAENAWLYLGDRPRFEASLEAQPSDPRATVAAFYRGYLALADGNAPAAVDWFQRSYAGGPSYSQFSDLAAIYECIASGDRPTAKQRLQALSATRTGLRVPDGEFTFKLAEAYALVGEPALSQETAEKAFSQGFGCAAWYEQSPFLGPLRASPRWRALMAHLLERQRLLERAFPPSAFA